MIVHTIELENFMSHDKTSVELPETGVVVIQGANGSGKSTLVEAVSVAHWGRTLRGTPAWRTGVGGKLIVESNLAGITRKSAPKGSKTISSTTSPSAR